MIRRMGRRVGAYLAATGVAYLLAAVAATQFVISGLGEMGVEVDLATRIHTTAHDAVGMAAGFLPLVAAALAIGLPIASLVARFLPRFRTVVLMLGGAVALLMVHLGLKWSFDVWTILAGSTLGGLLLQAASGAIGALVFALLCPLRTGPAHSES